MTPSPFQQRNDMKKSRNLSDAATLERSTASVNPITLLLFHAAADWRVDWRVRAPVIGDFPDRQREAIVRYSLVVGLSPGGSPGGSVNFVKKMKRQLTGLLRQYQAALRKHLKQGSRASLRPASKLGRHAVDLGMEKRELIWIHERAVAALELSKKENELGTRAEIFLSAAVAPIVKLTETLGWRKLKLAATNRRLHRDIHQRKSAEAVLKKSGQQRTRLLQDSLQRQEGARHRAHAMLSAQENERVAMSRQLQDEIVQTLVGIKVRLLNLEKAAKGGSDVRKEIASTQRLVEESVQSINRFAHELDIR